MSFRSTIVLLIAFLALCAGYWCMIRFESKAAVEDVEAHKVFSFASTDVVSLEVQRAEEAPVAAKRESGKPWMMTKPNAVIEPNQVVWDRLATSFADLVEERILEPTNEKAAQYGLDKPVLKVIGQTSDGQPFSCTFGAADPTQTGRYAMGQDGRIFLIFSKAFQDMDKPLDALRKPYVLDSGDKVITKIEFARYWTERREQNAKEKGKVAIGEESLVITVEKDANGLWRMKTPYEAAANQQLVNTVVRYVQFATGRNYIDTPQNLKEYGLDPAECRVTVYTEGSNPQTLFIGDPEPTLKKTNAKSTDPVGYYAKVADRPSVFVLDGVIAGMFPETPDAFRENRMMSRPANTLNKIHYAAMETDLVLEHDPQQGWSMVGLQPGETDQVAVSHFITLLTSMKGKGFPGDPQPHFGLDKPAINITLGFKDDATPAEIKVGSKMSDTEQYYAMQDNGIVTLLNGIDVTTLTKTILDFRSKDLLQFPKMGTSRIVLEIDGVPYIFNKLRGEWHVLAPENKTLTNPEAIDTLAGTLSETRATTIETMEANPNLAAFGLDAPVATVSVNFLQEGATTETTIGPLKIGKPDPQNSQLRYALVGSKAGVYKVKQELVDQFRDVIKCVQ